MKDDEVHATKIVRPLSDANVGLFLDRLYAKIGTSNPVEKYGDLDVYRFGGDEIGYVVLVNAGIIVYFVRHKRISNNALRLGRQVLVWRSEDDPESLGFAAHVFFDYLLPKYGALIADKEQTEHGRRFWTNMIGLAFRKRKHVYFLDRRHNPNTLYAVRNTAALRAVKNELWGTDAQHLYTFAVISDKALRLKAS